METSTKHYSHELKEPKTNREGLQNFVQMIINEIEDGNPNEALLKAVDLRQDIMSGIYDGSQALEWLDQELQRRRGGDKLTLHIDENGDYIAEETDDYNWSYITRATKLRQLIGSLHLNIRTRERKPSA